VQIKALGLNWPCNVGGVGVGGAYIQVSDLRAIMTLLFKCLC
jgi:hypothetical protein